MPSRKSMSVTVRFDGDEFEKLKIAAALKGSSVSSYVRNRLFSEAGQNGMQRDWILDDLMHMTSSNTRILESLKHIMLYIMGRQVSSLDLKKLQRRSLPEFYQTLDPDIAKFCQSLLDNMED